VYRAYLKAFPVRSQQLNAKPVDRASITSTNAPLYNDHTRISHNLLERGGMPMPVAYRLMNPAEEPAVLSLWSTLFNVPYMQEEQRFTSDPHRYQTTFVAVAADGSILSTAHYRVYERRDADGTARRVGELDPIATRSDAQRQGHATRLITHALAAMQQQACDWSILETSDEGRSLYERLGWQAFPMRYRRGALASQRPVCPTSHQTRRYELPIGAQDWAQFARLYTVYNLNRPLTVVRNPGYWQSFTAVRLIQRIMNEHLQVIGAWSTDTPTQLCGYILVHFFDFAFLVKEMGVLPGETSAIAALLAAVGDEASRRDLVYGEVELPHEAPLDALIADLFGASLHLSDANTRIMARPIKPGFHAEQLEAIFQAPGAFYSGIDHF
jgi:GNAT superfamily N-acetyltransferase